MSIKILINGSEFEFEENLTLIQALEQIDIEVPRFCYHDKLSIAGNCRMCLVEVKGAPKPVASCHFSLSDLRPGPNGELPEVLTNTNQVHNARKGAMEFLLVNHPLDCPICDQGGECDLQDQALHYGINKSRYKENKRAVDNKDIGPLVKTTMTRCIHCTRCVRFTSEVAGTEELGAIHRGENMEITTYLEKGMSSELQGNIIDLCPVGALTSKPYEYHARPWELKKTESIDVMDALGSNIRIDSKGTEVMRIMPRYNEEINEEWISDKTRFVWDGLRTQRIDSPYIRENGKLIAASWDSALTLLTDLIKKTDSSRIGAIAGDMVSAEEMFLMKKLMEKIGSDRYDCRQDGSILSNKYGRSSYIFNPTIAGIESADAMVIIGSNPRMESPVLNARIRKRWLTGELKVYLIGQEHDLTYDYNHIGSSPKNINLKNLELSNSKNIIWLLGDDVFLRDDGMVILSKVIECAEKTNSLRSDWNGLAILHKHASRVAGLDLGFLPQDEKHNSQNMAKSKEIELLFLLDADEVDAENKYKIYIGSHGDKGASNADIVLPGACYTEKNGLFMNTEGRLQEINRAVFPPGDARDNWKIIIELSKRLKKSLNYINLEDVRADLRKEYPVFTKINQIENNSFQGLDGLYDQKKKLSSDIFSNTVSDYYLTNSIARSSKVMAECSMQKNSIEIKNG
ncbi:MAG: NADH-quinone oxidoreductase subunit G [Hyphomicrobiales bacterium]|nr:MAG: NADH-quinone oxidoreductase subunit G [Hyphomicrobiales bacterium]|tara:strand:+ start:444 stop:2498 length:2055 start_codon:yes stop_codon:yes gene_type:complete